MFFIIFKILDAVHIHSHNIIKYKLGYALSSMQLYIKHIFSHFHTFFDSSNRKINPPSYLIFDLYIYFLICVVLLGTRLCWSQILFKKYINVFILFRSEWWTCQNITDDPVIVDCWQVFFASHQMSSLSFGWITMKLDQTSVSLWVLKCYHYWLLHFPSSSFIFIFHHRQI